MTLLEKIDYALLGLYNQTNLKIGSAFTKNGQTLTDIELLEIKNIIQSNEYATFQIEPKGIDYRGFITKKGIEFVENNSFSQPGTSILNL
jgi:hypothetical protein